MTSWLWQFQAKEGDHALLASLTNHRRPTSRLPLVIEARYMGHNHYVSRFSRAFLANSSCRLECYFIMHLIILRGQNYYSECSAFESCVVMAREETHGMIEISKS